MKHKEVNMFEDIIDPEVIYSPVYWILTAGTIVALLLGFASQSAWSSELTMPFMTKAIIIVLIPIVAYFVVLMIKNR